MLEIKCPYCDERFLASALQFSKAEKELHWHTVLKCMRSPPAIERQQRDAERAQEVRDWNELADVLYKARRK